MAIVLAGWVALRPLVSFRVAEKASVIESAVTAAARGGKLAGHPSVGKNLVLLGSAGDLPVAVGTEVVPAEGAKHDDLQDDSPVVLHQDPALILRARVEQLDAHRSVRQVLAYMVLSHGF